MNYEAYIHDSLRNAVKEILKAIETSGLDGENQLYITFKTSHPGVVAPTYLRAKHPNSMTIILQHQYWDLQVHDDYFEVSVSFSGHQTHLEIPFKALIAIVDPSEQFGLELDSNFMEDSEEYVDSDTAVTENSSGDSLNPDRGTLPGLEEGHKANVVSLDDFRKKIGAK